MTRQATRHEWDTVLLYCAVRPSHSVASKPGQCKTDPGTKMDKRYVTTLSSSRYFHCNPPESAQVPIPVSHQPFSSGYISTLRGHIRPLNSLTGHATDTGALRTLPAHSGIDAGHRFGMGDYHSWRTWKRGRAGEMTCGECNTL